MIISEESDNQTLDGEDEQHWVLLVTLSSFALSDNFHMSDLGGMVKYFFNGRLDSVVDHQHNHRRTTIQ